MSENIFISADPSFQLALRSITELRRKGCLKYTDPPQEASIEEVRSDKTEPLHFKKHFDFSRRLGACARLCMLVAGGMKSKVIEQSKRFYERNYKDQENFNKSEINFSIEEDDWEKMKEYCGEYDRLYTHVSIEEKMRSCRARSLSMPSMVLIFRGRGFTFKEVIQISTTVTIRGEEKDSIRKLKDGKVKCYVAVQCIRAKITDAGKCSKYMCLLQALCQAHATMWREEADGELVDAFKGLKLGTETDSGSSDNDEDGSSGSDEDTLDVLVGSMDTAQIRKKGKNRKI